MSQTNGAYETYNNKYTKDTTSMFVTLPSNSSISYEVEITNKINTGYLVKTIEELSNTNSNININIGLNINDIINKNSTKKFTIVFTNTTNEQQIGTLVLKYSFKENKFTVTLNEGNIYYTTNRTDYNLDINYDETTSILTLNGTSTSTTPHVSLHTYHMTFNEGDTYTNTKTYISGSATGTGRISISGEIKKEDTQQLDERHYADLELIGGRNINTMTINSHAATYGEQLYLHLWFENGVNSYTFDNYKVKINFAKTQAKEVMYGSTYGTLPTLTKSGFTFLGWNTDEFGNGKTITSTSQVIAPENHTIYAIWKAN